MAVFILIESLRLLKLRRSYEIIIWAYELDCEFAKTSYISTTASIFTIE